jgi:carbonic anhydrase
MTYSFWSMRKLIEGIITFRQRVRPEYRETFARLALGQQPSCLFITCSDSRVVPNLLTSTEPGDLFVARNVGNLVPPNCPSGCSAGDEAEAAAIEYAVSILKVQDIIVCGHSSCGAMRAVLESADSTSGEGGGAAMPHLQRWLRHALPALEQLQAGRVLDPSLSRPDLLSQLNVLQQVAHVASYPVVAERMASGALGVHGWWFDIASADVYAYAAELDRFVPIDESRLRVSTPLGQR